WENRLLRPTPLCHPPLSLRGPLSAAAGHPCGQPHTSERRSPGARNACREARRPRVALRNARARNWPLRPKRPVIAAVQETALHLPGRRRTVPERRAWLRVPARVGRAPTPSPARIRLRSSLRVWAWYCREASVDPRAICLSFTAARPSVEHNSRRGDRLKAPVVSAHMTWPHRQWLAAAMGGTK